MTISQNWKIYQKPVDKYRIKLYNPSYKDGEVMYWKSKICSAVLLVDNSSGTGFSVGEDFKQTDCHRSYRRIGFPIDRISDLGRILLSQEHIRSCNSFISFISNACPWGRRYQIIFHDRQYTYNSGIIQMHGIWICGRRFYGIYISSG